MSDLARNSKMSHSVVIPDLSDKSGQVLLASEYQELGFTTAIVSMAELLTRPGIERLKEMSSRAELWPWPGKLILSSIPPTKFNPKYKQGSFHFRSPINGAHLHYQLDDVIQLAEQLGFDHCVLAKEFIDQPAQTSIQAAMKEMEETKVGYLLEQGEIPPSYHAYAQLLQMAIGRAYVFNAKQSDFYAFQQALATSSRQDVGDSFIMVSGDFNPAQTQALVSCGVNIIDSRQLFSYAIEGQLFHRQGLLNIVDNSYQ